MSENQGDMQAAVASLYKKMAGVMGRISRVPRRGHNDRFNYDYVLDGDVLDAVRNAMAEEGLAFFVTMGAPEFSAIKTRSGEMPLVRLPIIATFADGETGATYQVNWIGEAMDGQDKGYAKAATSGIKYLLLKTFLISTGENDPDGDEGKKPAKTAAKPRAKKAAAKPAAQPAAKPAAGHTNGAVGYEDKVPHWIEQENVRKAFWAWATGDQENSMGLTNDQVHEALNVEHVKEFAGTMVQAREWIEAWVKAQSEEVPA